MMTSGPAAVIARDQPGPLPARPGRDDVAGFVVVGQPFASGDLLCLRRFPASTFGPGYISVWHRALDGRWTVYTSIAPEQSCPRFVGAAVSRVVETPIALTWSGGADLDVRVPEPRLRWTLHVESTPVTRLMNGMMACMPAALFRSNAVLSAMSLLSTLMLAAGRLQLNGHVPNRQWFQAAPRRVWAVGNASASLAGRDFGAPQPLARQVRLGDVPMPQRGLVMMGKFSFEAFTPGVHLPPRPEAYPALA
jgi:hypothetical protein